MAKESLSDMRKRAAKVLTRLTKRYGKVRCTLDHVEPLQLVISTILSAQCTDERVNIVTKALFKRFRKAQDYVDVPQEELEKYIKSCGFYHNKAKNIQGACKAIIERFGGVVPSTMEELLTLDGVGRKTANVVLAECFGGQGIIVDTHCTRLSQRLGFTKSTDPVNIEQELMKIVPDDSWTLFSHCLVFHGRNICMARSPNCAECPVSDLCPFPTKRKTAK